MNGWTGRILRVDLGTGKITEEALDPDLAVNYLGGRGLGVQWLYREAMGADPLGPENLLVLAAGPLTGTRAPTAGRVTAVSRSPLTGTICDSSAGGAFGARLKRSGYDALVIRGTASQPVYLEVNPEKVSLKEADGVWGRDIPDSIRFLRRHSPRRASFLVTGPAGEAGVPFASASVDGERQLGRGGLGAVMGAKRLKAVSVFGDRLISVADPNSVDFILYEIQKLLEANPITSQAMPQFGTAMLVNLLNQTGCFPSRNFRDGFFASAESISGERLRRDYFSRRSACFGCPIGCGRIVRLDGREERGPEYETIWALGAGLGIDSLESIIKANLLCNRLGLDTISTGGTLACAMELKEKGLWPDGPAFGQANEVLKAIPRIALGQGDDAGLGQGSRSLARQKGVPELAMQVKGMEMPAYDPRGMQGQGLGLATSNRGACHLRGNMLGPEILGSPKMVDRLRSSGKAGLVIYMQHNSAVLDSLVMCKFTTFAIADEHYARLLRAVTGLDWRTQDLQRVGERIWNLERLYNLAVGIGAEADTLPRRLLEEPGRGRPVDLSSMLSEYYRFRAWTTDGRPTVAKLEELGLSQGSEGACFGNSKI